MVSTLGMLFYGQHPDTAAMVGMAVIACGIAIMNLFSKMGAEEESTKPVEEKPSAAISSIKNNVAH